MAPSVLPAIVAAVAVLLCSGCEQRQHLRSTSAAPETLVQLPGWSNDRSSEALAAFLRSCARPRPAWASACSAGRVVPPGDDGAARQFFAAHFRPGQGSSGLVTGYFEPEVPGSRTADGRFHVPVLRPPAHRGQHSRTELLDGALNGQGLEIVYLQSFGDLYLIQMQGAARVRLPDGTLVRLSHAGDNGRPSVPIGRLFSGAGTLRGELSYRALRAWMLFRPGEAERRIRQDPSYVFFGERPRDADPTLGTVGLSGTPLTPLRSVGVDPQKMPFGTPMWLDVETPAGRLSRMVVAQDAGEPISGPGRLDLYWGWGSDAETHGGRMHANGRIWPLLPR